VLPFESWGRLGGGRGVGEPCSPLALLAFVPRRNNEPNRPRACPPFPRGWLAGWFAAVFSAPRAGPLLLLIVSAMSVRTTACTESSAVSSSRGPSSGGGFPSSTTQSFGDSASQVKAETLPKLPVASTCSASAACCPSRLWF
jgi:hypothetical protein